MGILLLGISMVLAPGSNHQLLGLLLFASPDAITAFEAPAVSYITLVHGVLGAVLFGWGVALLFVLLGPFRRGAREGWLTFAVSIVAWFVPDTAFSLWTGFWQNAVLNGVLALAFAIPLAATYRVTRAIRGRSRLKKRLVGSRGSGGLGGAPARVRTPSHDDVADVLGGLQHPGVEGHHREVETGDQCGGEEHGCQPHPHVEREESQRDQTQPDVARAEHTHEGEAIGVVHRHAEEGRGIGRRQQRADAEREEDDGREAGDPGRGRRSVPTRCVPSSPSTSPSGGPS